MINTTFVSWIVQRRVSGKLYHRYQIMPIELQCLVIAATYLMLKGKKSAKIDLFIGFYAKSHRKKYTENRRSFYKSLVDKGFMNCWIYKRTGGFTYSISPKGFKVLDEAEQLTEGINKYYREHMNLYSVKELEFFTNKLLELPNLFELNNA